MNNIRYHHESFYFQLISGFEAFEVSPINHATKSQGLFSDTCCNKRYFIAKISDLKPKERQPGGKQMVFGELFIADMSLVSKERIKDLLKTVDPEQRLDVDVENVS